MLQMVAESALTTPPPVEKAFLRVLVRFGVVRAAIWRLPAMVGVVDLSSVGLKMARRASSQKIKLLFNSVQNHYRESEALGLNSKSDTHVTELLFGSGSYSTKSQSRLTTLREGQQFQYLAIIS